MISPVWTGACSDVGDPALNLNGDEGVETQVGEWIIQVDV